MKKIATVLLAMAMVFSMVACNTQPVTNEVSTAPASEVDEGTIASTEGEYVIGFEAPLTGNNAQDGIAGMQGAQLAVEQVNAAGGINGVPVRLHTADDKADPKESAMVANKFAEDSSILVMVGPALSSGVLAISSIIEGRELSCISFGASSAAVSGCSQYVFRTIPTDAVGGRYLIKWLEENNKPQRVGIFYENSDFGVGVHDVFAEQLKEDGVSIVAEQSFLPDETSDFTTGLTALKSANIDLLVLGCSYNEAALICKQAITVGLDVPIASIDACYSQALIDLGGDAVNGMMFTAFFSVDNQTDMVQSFVADYRAKYNEDPNTFSAYAYDATLIAIDAIKTAGADRTAINEYLRNVKDFEGVTGLNTFDELGDVSTKEPIIIQVQDSKFVVIG